MEVVTGQVWSYNNLKTYTIGEVKRGRAVLLNERGEITNTGYRTDVMIGDARRWKLVRGIPEPLVIHCPNCRRKREIPQGDYICEGCRAAGL